MFMLFFTVAAISFLGLVHPGTVNVAVVQTTLNRHLRAGLWLAVGGCLPEILYGGLAAGGLSLLDLGPATQAWLHVTSAGVLAVAGVITLRQGPVPTQREVTAKAGPFGRGLLLSLANPQLLPFWSAVWVGLVSNGLWPVGGTWVFATGAAAGAFALLALYAWLANRYRTPLLTYLTHRTLNYLSGGFLLTMAGWQLGKFLFSTNS